MTPEFELETMPLGTGLGGEPASFWNMVLAAGTPEGDWSVAASPL